MPSNPKEREATQYHDEDAQALEDEYQDVGERGGQGYSKSGKKAKLDSLHQWTAIPDFEGSKDGNRRGAPVG